MKIVCAEDKAPLESDPSAAQMTEWLGQSRHKWALPSLLLLDHLACPLPSQSVPKALNSKPPRPHYYGMNGGRYRSPVGVHGLGEVDLRWRKGVMTNSPF